MTTAMARAEERGVGPAADAGPLLLQAWLSPGYPVGAYAYSHGLEWAVEQGDVADEASLAAWLADALVLGAGRNDAIILAAAFRAAARSDLATLVETNALALALAPSRELRLQTSQQGRSFLDATCTAWPHPGLLPLADALSAEVAYPVAVGAAAAAHGVTLRSLLPAFLLAFVQAVVSAALRLAPIGPAAGLRVIAATLPTIRQLAEAVSTTTLDDLGSATFRADLGSCRHETQHTRLFRS
jgi:urease accessory protein